MNFDIKKLGFVICCSQIHVSLKKLTFFAVINNVEVALSLADISRLRPTRLLREGVPNYVRLFLTAKPGQGMWYAKINLIDIRVE